MGSAPLDLLAAVTGRIVPIEAVPDPAFSEKMVGDGVAIDPEGTLVTAPCAGRVVQVHRAHHAYGIEAATGARVLVHVGLETVELKGEGFTPRVSEGDRVQAGQPLVEVDRAVLARRGVSPLTVIVVENVDEHPIGWRASAGAPVRGGADVVLRLGEGGDRPSTGSGGTEGAGGGSAGGGAHLAGSTAASGRATVLHGEGLHARPAAVVAAAARRYRASVQVLAHGRSANARSPIALMGLAVGASDEVEIVAAGPDAEAARDAVIAAIQAGEGEALGPARPSTGSGRTDSRGSAHPSTGSERTDAEVRRTPAAPHVNGVALAEGEVAGVVASRGLAIGETIHLRWEPAGVSEEGRGEAYERGELERALREVAADLDGAVAGARRARSSEEAEILEAHRALIEDPELFAGATARVAAGRSAAHAWSSAIREHSRMLEATGIPLLAERVADLRDLERQVVAKLTGKAPAVPELPERAILLAEDLSPGELAALDRGRLAGIVTHRGGPTSHVSIVARSQGIPALVAAGPALRLVPDGRTAVLDAERGVLSWRPTTEGVESARARIARAEARRVEARRSAREPAITLDGVRIEVAANVSRPEEAAEAASQGADGVGLLRTELLFLGRETAPTEEEQRQAYQAVVDALGGRTVIVRTLDVGADKSLPYLPMPREENPALGLRGIRLGLLRKELLAEQLRACLRVRPLERIRLMLPMVTDLADVLGAREVLRLAAAELGVAPPELGIMVETPAAALLADVLAAEVDFVSLGTNDLTQYTLAMDRGNPAVAQRVDDLHPAVLRLVAATVEGASRHGRWVGVCGGMAANPLAVPLLVGMGVTELSVGPAAVPEVKALVRRLDRAACAEVARRARELGSPGEVREHVRAAVAGLEPPPT